MNMNSAQNSFLNFIGGNTNVGRSGLGKQSVGPTNLSNPVGNVWLGGDSTSRSITDFGSQEVGVDDAVQLSGNAQMMLVDPGENIGDIGKPYIKEKYYEFMPTEKDTERFLVYDSANYSDEQIKDKVDDYYLDKLGINSHKVNPSERESILRQHGIVIRPNYDLSSSENPGWVEDQSVGRLDGYRVFYDSCLDIYSSKEGYTSDEGSSDYITIGSWEKTPPYELQGGGFDEDGKPIFLGGPPEGHTQAGGDPYIDKIPWKDPMAKPGFGGLTPTEPGGTTPIKRDYSQIEPSKYTENYTLNNDKADIGSQKSMETVQDYYLNKLGENVGNDSEMEKASILKSHGIVIQKELGSLATTGNSSFTSPSEFKVYYDPTLIPQDSRDPESWLNIKKEPIMIGVWAEENSKSSYNPLEDPNLGRFITYPEPDPGIIRPTPTVPPVIPTDPTVIPTVPTDPTVAPTDQPQWRSNINTTLIDILSELPDKVTVDNLQLERGFLDYTTGNTNYGLIGGTTIYKQMLIRKGVIPPHPNYVRELENRGIDVPGVTDVSNPWLNMPDSNYEQFSDLLVQLFTGVEMAPNPKRV